MDTRLKQFFPFLGWRSWYKASDFSKDLNAGIVVTVMIIPQAMAVALIAGLPPIMGLYASVVPLFLYALFGTSRQLSVSPVALLSLLVASGVGQLAEPGGNDYILLAMVLAGMVGAIQLLMGFARLGFLVNFLSHPVISGFTSAAAIIIGASQLKNILGVDIPSTSYVHEVLWHVAQNVNIINLPTVAIGAAAILFLLIMKRNWPKLPAALVVVLIGTWLVWQFNLAEVGVRIVGKVPDGLPMPSLPEFKPDTLLELLPIALTIAFVGFMESIAIARSFAFKYRYDVDANQELIALGLANLSAFLFKGFPVAGSFSRSAVNATAGARSGISSILTAILISIVLLFLTPLFYYLPKAVLAAIIMVAITGLFEFRELRFLWRIKRSDFLVWIVAFSGTLALGIQNGILVSVVVSLIIVVRRTTHPHTAVLGRVPGTNIFRNMSRISDAEEIAGLLICRFDAPLYFANISYLKSWLEEAIKGREDTIKAVVFDGSTITNIDSSAISGLLEIHADLLSIGIELYFANLHGPVRDVLKRAGFKKRIGKDHFFHSKRAAVAYFEEVGKFKSIK